MQTWYMQSLSQSEKEETIAKGRRDLKNPRSEKSFFPKRMLIKIVNIYFNSLLFIRHVLDEQRQND